MTAAVVVGGGIAGLAAALRLERLLPEPDVVLLEAGERLGGKILTERVDGFLVEGASDSFLTRKPRGLGLCEELGLTGRLQPRDPRHERTYVRLGDALHPLPAGLTGMIPTRLEALAESDLLSPEGRARLAGEPELPAAPEDAGDESIAAFVTRRLGREAYERLVEPLASGIFAGDGEQLSLAATFPGLRRLELEHGSLLRGLRAQSEAAGDAGPPFVTLRGGMGELVQAAAGRLARTRVRTGAEVVAVRRSASGYEALLASGEAVGADAVVLALPAHAVAVLTAELDPELARAHAGIPHASSALVTLSFAASEVPRPLDAYGYVVPRVEGSDVLACTWTSSKWTGRAPTDRALLRVYLGRFGGPDVTTRPDGELVALARREVGETLGVTAAPGLARVHRWLRGMPQYVLGHLERLDAIERRLAEQPGLAVAGAAYRGVGIPDCIASGEEAAHRVAAVCEGPGR